MYTLAMYNLSPIQQGIQSAHAIVEYGQKHDTPAYRQWASKDKTIIVLNGGTSNTGDVHLCTSTGEPIPGEAQQGTMEAHADMLGNIGHDHARFFEPDLNHSLSAIAFLVPASVYGLTVPEGYEPSPINPDGRYSNYWFKNWLDQFRLA